MGGGGGGGGSAWTSAIWSAAPSLLPMLVGLELELKDLILLQLILLRQCHGVRCRRSITKHPSSVLEGIVSERATLTRYLVIDSECLSVWSIVVNFPSKLVVLLLTQNNPLTRCWFLFQAAGEDALTLTLHGSEKEWTLDLELNRWLKSKFEIEMIEINKCPVKIIFKLLI